MFVLKPIKFVENAFLKLIYTKKLKYNEANMLSFKEKYIKAR